MHPLHFRKLVEDTLSAMGPPYDSPAAVELLLLTASQESKLGLYLWQAKRDGSPGGPAIGPYQMEPGRFMDTMTRWPEGVELAVTSASGFPLGEIPGSGRMATDLRFATAMARAAYWLIPESLPAADDLNGLASYWHRHWCRGCKGQPADAIRNYRRYVLRQKEES